MARNQMDFLQHFDAIAALFQSVQIRPIVVAGFGVPFDIVPTKKTTGFSGGHGGCFEDYDRDGSEKNSKGVHDYCCVF